MTQQPPQVCTDLTSVDRKEEARVGGFSDHQQLPYLLRAHQGSSSVLHYVSCCSCRALRQKKSFLLLELRLFLCTFFPSLSRAQFHSRI